jgi:hypothetical protein
VASLPIVETNTKPVKKTPKILPKDHAELITAYSLPIEEKLRANSFRMIGLSEPIAIAGGRNKNKDMSNAVTRIDVSGFTRKSAYLTNSRTLQVSTAEIANIVARVEALGNLSAI